MPKNTLRMKKYLSLFLLLLAFASCGGDKKETAAPGTKQEIAVETSGDKSKLETYYQLPHIKEWYTKRILPPPFDYNMDLSRKTAMELRLLRNEIYARNGYLFEESDLRGHFNQYDWYQPIFEVDDFKVYLNEQEQQFIQKVEALEKSLESKKYINGSEGKLVDLGHVVNLMQFENIDKEMTQALKSKNFAIVKADHDQLFYVYDNNQYEYIPNFVTTDLYIELMHKYLSGQMQEIEEEKLMGTVRQLIDGLYKRSKEAGDSPATLWAQTFLAVASTQLSGKKASVDPSIEQAYKQECDNIAAQTAKRSEFLQQYVDYSSFLPRGNYTKTEQLQRYFRCIKWLNTVPMNTGNAERFTAALQMACWIKEDASLSKHYKTFNDAILLLAGEEDNVSISHLIRILDKHNINGIQKIPGAIDKIRADVDKLDVDRIRPVGATAAVQQELGKPDVLFSAARYSMDAEIFTKLINIKRPAVKRPFPKSLDVFASLGNQTAESILLNTYHEKQNWPAYADSLKKMKKQFGSYNSWNLSMYTKTMEAIHAMSKDPGQDAPLFMQTKAWKKKNLNTSLAAYTQLKHDLILYSEQPMAAEAGQGGGPPPPKKISYVEPNVAFWSKAIELLDFQRQGLQKLGLLTENLKTINAQMKELAGFLLAVSNKELKKQPLSEKEFERLDWIGGEVERLTFAIMKTDHLPERDNQIALAADVYTYNNSYLESAIGKVNEIYVIAEINGHPYLTRGACFSYYEFVSGARLTDEAWQKQLDAGNAPDTPVWMNELYVKTKPLKSKPGYSF